MIKQLTCLSVQQPWAWTILNGFKGVENRTWATNYRGLLGIHAGKSKESMDFETIQFIRSQGVTVPPDLTFGAILGTVELYDCVPIENINDPWAFGPFCWKVRDPKLFRNPVPFRGALGLFTAQIESE